MCSVAGADTLIMDRRKNNEPEITIPSFPGWLKINRGVLPGTDSIFNSAFTRGVVVNVGLTENKFPPNIIVTLDSYPDVEMSPEEISNLEDKKLGKISRILNRTSEEVCGNRVFVTEFSDLRTSITSAPRSGTLLLTVVDAPDGTRWASTATIQTSNPENPDYITQRGALLDGFHMSARMPPN